MMRRFLPLVGLMALCAFALTAIGGFVFTLVVMYGGLDIERTYSTRADALKDQAFERGMLPDFIPQSATNISIKYISDVCVTNGIFRFRPDDYQEFVKAIHSSDDGDRRHGIAVLREGDLLREGYKNYYYNHGSTCCRFLIHPEQGRCEFSAGGLFRAN